MKGTSLIARVTTLIPLPKKQSALSQRTNIRDPCNGGTRQSLLSFSFASRR